MALNIPLPSNKTIELNDNSNTFSNKSFAQHSANSAQNFVLGIFSYNYQYLVT